jgi:hypothetical protein
MIWTASSRSKDAKLGKAFRTHLTPEARQTTITVHGVYNCIGSFCGYLKIGASQTTIPGSEVLVSGDIWVPSGMIVPFVSSSLAFATE